MRVATGFLAAFAVTAVQSQRSLVHSDVFVPAENEIGELMEKWPIVGVADNPSATVTVSQTLVEDGDMITVKIHNLGQPSSHDWVGGFSPADANVTSSTPVKFTWADMDPQYLQTGNATLRFRMVNTRASWRFHFFACAIHLRNTCTGHGASAEVRFVDPNAPSKARVVPTSDPTVFKVVWNSAQTLSPRLYWGPSPNRYTHSADAASYTYTRNDLCGAPAATYGFQDPGMFHAALMGPLGPREVVYYRFGDTHANGTEFKFVAPLAVGDVSTTTHLLTVGDLGRGTDDDSYTWHFYGRPAINTTKYMAMDIDAGMADAFYHIGDLSYAVGYLPVWDVYADMMEPVTAQRAYFVNLGNHEADTPDATLNPGQRPTLYNRTDSGGECSVVTDKQYPMPWASVNTPWYSYDVGSVHVVAMSTEHDFRRGTEQWNWIKSDLSSVNRSVTPWILFGGHRPMYISSTYTGPWYSDQVVASLLQEHLEPLFLEHGVDVAIWGHNHAYQRLSAAKGGEGVAHGPHYTNPPAPVHMIIGTGGAGFTVNAMHPPPSYAELVMYEYGYARISANGSQFVWEFVSNNNGTVLDTMSITKVAEPSQQHHHHPDAIRWLSTPAGAATLVVVGLAVVGAGLFAFFRARRAGVPGSHHALDADGHVPASAITARDSSEPHSNSPYVSIHGEGEA
jgi:hypothetical protein